MTSGSPAYFIESISTVYSGPSSMPLLFNAEASQKNINHDSVGGGGGSKVGRFRTFPKIEFGLKNINHDSIGGGFSKMF